MRNRILSLFLVTLFITSAIIAVPSACAGGSYDIISNTSLAEIYDPVEIPEFPTAILGLISALVASLFLIRWRRQTIVFGR